MYVTKVGFEISLPPFTSSRMLELAMVGARKDIINYAPGLAYATRKAEIYSPTVGFKDPLFSDSAHMGGGEPSSARRTRTTAAECQTVKEVFGLTAKEVADLGANPLHAVAWLNPDFDGGRTETPQDVIVGGGQLGTEVDEILAVMSSVDDRFDTQSDIDTDLASGNIITDILQIGATTVFTFADNADPTLATAGGIGIYANGIVTVAQLNGSDYVLPMYALEYDSATDRYIAVGANGKILAAKKTSLTVLSDLSDASVTDDFVDIALRQGIGYIAAIDGNAYTLSGSVVTDITSAVVGSIAPSTLNSVEYLGNHHIMFGGASGFISETLDLETWFPEQINNGAGTVGVIVGETWRTFLGIDGVIHERSVVTFEESDLPEKIDWRILELEGGADLDGTITDIALLDWMAGPNVLAIVTDAAEIAYAKPGVMQY
jgi:hypothetical protein